MWVFICVMYLIMNILSVGWVGGQSVKSWTCVAEEGSFVAKSWKESFKGLKCYIQTNTCI